MRVQGSGFRVQGSGFRVQGSGLRPGKLLRRFRLRSRLPGRPAAWLRGLLLSPACLKRDPAATHDEESSTTAAPVFGYEAVGVCDVRIKGGNPANKVCMRTCLLMYDPASLGLAACSQVKELRARSTNSTKQHKVGAQIRQEPHVSALYLGVGVLAVGGVKAGWCRSCCGPSAKLRAMLRGCRLPKVCRLPLFEV